MHKKTRLWLVAALMGSIPPAHAGRPSTPTQPPAQPAPAAPNPTAPNPGPTTNTPQVSGTPNSADSSTNPQPGFLDTTAGKGIASVGGVVALGVIGYGAKKANDGYRQYKVKEKLDKDPSFLKKEVFTQAIKNVQAGLQDVELDQKNRELNNAKLIISETLSDQTPHDVYNEQIHKALETLKIHIDSITAPQEGNSVLSEPKIKQLHDNLRVLHDHYVVLGEHMKPTK
jgi:hypothetical protein